MSKGHPDVDHTGLVPKMRVLPRIFDLADPGFISSHPNHHQFIKCGIHLSEDTWFSCSDFPLPPPDLVFRSVSEWIRSVDPDTPETVRHFSFHGDLKESLIPVIGRKISTNNYILLYYFNLFINLIFYFFFTRICRILNNFRHNRCSSYPKPAVGYNNIQQSLQ